MNLIQALKDYPQVFIANQNRWLCQDILRTYLSTDLLKTLNWTVYGQSEEGRELHYTQIGNGKRKVLIWSQMHGNEATGTLALIELLSLLQLNEALFSAFFKEFTVCFVPMVNPDGSELFTRRNALLIDNNRDLIARQASETKAIVSLIDQIGPQVAVNLHDQRDIFGASEGEPATISFLAPSFNESREVNDHRLKCMKLVVALRNTMEEDISGKIGRYTDEFYPAAIGEFVQNKGIPCILIESGAYYDDPNREMARKMNVKGLLVLFQTLVDGSWLNYTQEEYLSIPQNKTNFFSCVIRNVSLKEGVTADLGLLKLQQIEKNELKEYYILEEVGDLRFKHGLEEVFAQKLLIHGELKLAKKADFAIPEIGLQFKNGQKT